MAQQVADAGRAGGGQPVGAAGADRERGGTGERAVGAGDDRGPHGDATDALERAAVGPRVQRGGQQHELGRG